MGWVGLDLYVCGFGWVVGYENGPMDNSGGSAPDPAGTAHDALNPALKTSVDNNNNNNNSRISIPPSVVTSEAVKTLVV